MTPAEQRRAVNVLIRDTLVKAGWTLVRDNEPGGTLVLEGDGLSIVGGFHAYPIKPAPATPESHAEVTVEDAFSKVLVPALPAGTGQIPVAWVAERYVDGSVEWWNGEEWQDMLSDGAALYKDDEKFGFEDANWVEVYMHETDGCLTTEPCPGVDTCPDCLDVRKSAGENLADDPMPGHTNSSEEDV